MAGSEEFYSLRSGTEDQNKAEQFCLGSGLYKQRKQQDKQAELILCERKQDLQRKLNIRAGEGKYSHLLLKATLVVINSVGQ